MSDFQWRRVALLTVATPLVVVPAVAVLGALFPALPQLGPLASPIVPPHVVWFVVVPLLGGLLAGLRGRFRLALAVLAVLTCVGASVITVRTVSAVDGADISLIRAFGIGAESSATPDADVTYTTFDDEPVQLSVYRPRSSDAPVLFYVHGGGWTAGSRDVRSADMRWFADRGWLVISTDYSLSSADRHTWDVAQAQLGCALSWVAQHAEEYGGDASRLSLTGDSAGGNLAINTAYLAATRSLPWCGGSYPEVGAVSALYPVVDPAGFHHSTGPFASSAREMTTAYTGGTPEQFPDRYTSITSATHLSAAAPPTLLLVGEADHLVPPEGAYRFADQARSQGVDVRLVRVPYADHVFDGAVGSIGQQAYRQLTFNWLRDHGQAP